MGDMIDQLIAEAVDSMVPRPGFASELLIALRGRPALAISDDESRSRVRWIVASALAGAASVSIVLVALHQRGRTRRSRFDALMKRS